MTTAIDQDQRRRLLAEGPWLRRLARRLGGQDADDLVQETWVAVLQHPPDPSRPARPWLHRVIQNFAGMAGRKKRRRETFERLESGDEQDLYAAQDSADAADDLERHELHHLLNRLLTQLEEPYRSAVVARYVCEQQLEEMAATLNIPAGTLRWRVNEGLRRLRERMKDEQTGRRSVKALAPALFVHEHSRAVSVWKGIIVTTKKTKVILAGLAAVLGGVASSFVLSHRVHDVRQSAPMNPAASSAKAAINAGEPMPEAVQENARALLPHELPALVKKNLPIFQASNYNGMDERPPTADAALPGAAVPEGELTRDVIAATIRSIIPGVKDCYEKLLEERPEARGRLVVSFTIADKDGVGKISEATIVPPNEDDPRPARSLPSQPLTELCILNAVQAASFPSPKGDGKVVVTYPFVFEPNAPREGKQNR